MLCSTKECCGCGVCVVACPVHCIELKEDEKGFLHPQINLQKCVGCRKCESVCPELGAQEKLQATPRAYAAACKEDDIRLRSSSGGVFYALATDTLQRGGVVFGAAMSADCLEVRHICVDTKEDLHRIMGSKYVQSIMGDSYKQVKQYLQAGREVVFSGTPCQVEALRLYLKNVDTSKLFLVDLICHGVPASGIWRRYLVEIAEDVRKVSFRDKSYGWKRYSLKVESEEKEIVEKENENAYLMGFLNHLYCRPSCFGCKHKGEKRNSDITLGDFWKVSKFLPNVDDDKGTSLLFVHSGKAREIVLMLIEKNLIWAEEVDVMKAAQSNPMMIESIKKNKKENKFWNLLQQYTVAESVEQSLRRSVFEKIIERIRWYLLHK